MNKIINELTKSIDNIKQSINNKYTSQNEDAPIGDNTLLKDYASAIDNILTETVDISQQIFVFYCWATNETDARSKTKPTITWNSSANKWSIECPLVGWSTSADEEELDPNQPNAEKYLYAMFVSVNTDTNSSNITWPDPIRLTGKTGAKGEDGSDGRDGVIAGMVQYLAAHLFKIVRREDVTTELTNKPELIYNYTQILSEANRHPKPDFLQIKNSLDQYVNISSTVNTPGTGGLSYELPSDNPENYAVLKCVANYNSLSRDVVVTDPIMLSGEGVVGWIEHYCITNNNTLPGDDATGTNNEIPNEFYDLGKHYLGNKTEIEYDSGRTVTTHPVMIMSSPNAIGTIECLYGQSSNISTEPDDWNENIPDDFIVLGKKETTNFTIGNSKVTITPIAVKGNPGVDILAQVEKAEVDRGTSGYMSSLDRDEYYLKKGIIVGKDLYIWNGSNKPEGTNNFGKTENDYYGIIIKDAFVIKVQADLYESDPTKPSYVKGAPVKRSTSSNSGSNHICGNIWLLDGNPRSELRKVTFTYKSVEITITNENPKVYFDEELYFVLHNNYITVHNGEWVEYNGESYQPNYTLKEIEGRLVEMLPTRNMIDLTTDDSYYSDFKLGLLKEVHQLIPGCVYKFKYGGKAWTVNALDNDTLDRYCYSNDSRITVNGNYQPSFDGTYRDIQVIEESLRIQIDYEFGGVIHVTDREDYDCDFLYDVTNDVVYRYNSGEEAVFSFSNPYFLNIIGYTDFNKNNEGSLFSEECVNPVGCNIVTFDVSYNNSVKIYTTNNDEIFNTVVEIDTGNNNDIRICTYTCAGVLIEITQVSDSVIDTDRSANFSNISNCYYYLRNSDDNQYSNQYNKRIDIRNEY